MARKDPQENREKSAASMRRLREHRKAEKMTGATAGAGKKNTRAAKVTAASKAPPKRGRPPAFKLESDLEWAQQLIVLGRSWVEQSKKMLPTNPTGAYNLGKAGIELINANRNLLPRPETDKGPQAGSVAALDGEFLHDPEYRRLAEALLARKCDLQIEREKQKA